MARGEAGPPSTAADASGAWRRESRLEEGEGETGEVLWLENKQDEGSDT